MCKKCDDELNAARGIIYATIAGVLFIAAALFLVLR